MFMDPSEANALTRGSPETPAKSRDWMPHRGWSSRNCGGATARPAKTSRRCGLGPLSDKALTRRRSSVLCIDKDGDRAGVLAAALTRLGCHVEIATSGDASLASILARRPNLVIYDFPTFREGGLEGCLELLEHLWRAGRQDNASPFVLLTRRASQPGDDDRVARPIELKPLDHGADNRSPEAATPAKGLTPREKDVLAWVARGKTSAEVAIILGLSERTINFHCDNAMKRLDVINRTQAVAKAVHEGLIGIE